MIIFTKDWSSLVNFINENNEEDAEWSIEYAAPGFFFYTEDKALDQCVSEYLKAQE